MKGIRKVRGKGNEKNREERGLYSLAIGVQEMNGGMQQCRGTGNRKGVWSALDITTLTNTTGKYRRGDFPEKNARQPRKTGEK